MKAVDIRCFPSYEAQGPEAEELRQIVAEALDEHLGSDIALANELIDKVVDDHLNSRFSPEDEEFFRSRPGDFEAGK